MNTIWKLNLIHASLCHLFLCSGEFYRVQLPSTLPAGAQLMVKVEMTFSHVLKPFPTHITQAERQLVVFQGNHYMYSPYPTRSQTTRVRLASKTVETYTKLGNPTKTDEFIEYGPFRDVAPFSEVRLLLAFLWVTNEAVRKSTETFCAVCCFLFRTRWNSISKTTPPSSPSAASLASSRCLTGATLLWRKQWTWGTQEPPWRARSHVTTTSVSQTVASHLSNPSRCSIKTQTVIWLVFAVKVMMMIVNVFLLLRPSSLPQPRMCTTEMRSGTSPPPTFRFWTTQWRWRSGLASPCLEVGRLITSSATICPATSTSTPWVSWLLIRPA